MLAVSSRWLAEPYLGMANIRTSLQRMGFDPATFDAGGSDEMVRRLVAQGDPEVIAGIVADHLNAGADHVALQAIPHDQDPLPALGALAQALNISPR